MTSLWIDPATLPADDPMPADGRYDDLVVGAGLTGLVTAVLLARAGRRVGVVEARHVGAVTTGHSTAKLSLLQGTMYSSMLRHQPQPVAQAYVDGNRAAAEWLRGFCAERGVDVQSREAVTFAASPQERRTVRDEHEAARTLGLDVRWTDHRDVGFPFHGGTVLIDQAQFDPMAVLLALCEELRAHGGTLHQGRRVVTAQPGRPTTVMLEGDEQLEAEHVVLATGSPILDRGLFFAKLEPTRSYAVAYDVPEAPQAMYLSAGSSSRSIRDAPDRAGGTRLLIGGNGHTVGRTRSERQHLDDLREWTAQHFPGAVETHAWSAQDYTSYDHMPYVGLLPGSQGRIFAATGYAKWGMSNAVCAGLGIAGRILGDRPSWSVPFEQRRIGGRSALEAARINAGVGLAEGVALAAAAATRAPQQPAEGDGIAGRDGVAPVAVSTVDGQTCRLLAVCTHLGGTLRWNDAEQSWDCPLHGSRFAPGGEVLEGPATRALKRLDQGQDTP